MENKIIELPNGLSIEVDVHTHERVIFLSQESDNIIIENPNSPT